MDYLSEWEIDRLKGRDREKRKKENKKQINC
jgi:hypothetical protein